MSSPSLPAPRRKRPYLWWIAGAVLVVLLACGVAAYDRLTQPIKWIYGFLSANPSLPGCTTSFSREDTAGPLWYRVVDVRCPDDQSMHFVYAKQGSGPGNVVLPAFMSSGDPVPVSVRRTDEAGFEIVLAHPLADGRSALPIELNPDGTIKGLQTYDHGRRTDKS